MMKKVRIVVRLVVPVDVTIDRTTGVDSDDKVVIRRESSEIPAVVLPQGWQPSEQAVKNAVDHATLRELYRAGEPS